MTELNQITHKGLLYFQSLERKVTEIDKVMTKVKLEDADKGRYQFMSDQISHARCHETLVTVMEHFIKQWSKYLTQDP